VQQLNEEGELARLNLSYYYSGFFDFSKGFDDNQLADALMLLPRPVAEQLDEWFRKKLQPTQDHTRKYFPSVIWQVPTFLWLWPLYYAQRRDRVRKWNDEMLKWQESINREVFIPNGMFLKTQSERPYTLCGRFATKRWFAIAMSAKEAKKLKQEPHVFGRTKFVGCSCLAEKDPLHEDDLCMHRP
jgi:hypothetical protein